MSNRYTIQVSARVLHWPQRCACCNQLNDTQYRISYTRTTGEKTQRSTTRYWDVPYCTQCVLHVQLAKDALSTYMVWLILIVIQGIIWYIAIHSWLIGILIAAPLWWFAHRRYVGIDIPKAISIAKATCCSINQAIEYKGWDGSMQTFDFTQKDYAENFAILNHSKVLTNHTGKR